MPARRTTSRSREQRVLICTPDDDERRMLRDTLSGVGFSVDACPDIGELCDEIGRGAATAVVAGDNLTMDETARLEQRLRQQSAWSDFPLILITSDSNAESHFDLKLDAIANSVIFERPLKRRSLISVVRIATRSRDSQYARRGEQIEREVSEQSNRVKTSELRERVREQSDTLRLLRDIATASNFAASVEEALAFTLAQVCRYSGWAFGHAYLPSLDDASILLPVDASYEYAPGRFQQFRKEMVKLRIPSGTGLVGRVYASGRPEWMQAVGDEPQGIRSRLCKQLGVGIAAAFPIMVGTEVVGVLEFFADESTEPDAQLLDAMVSIGTQLGRVIERDRLDRAMRESYRLLQKISETSPTMLRILDEVEGRYVHVNQRMASFLGTSVEEATQGGMERISAAIHPDDLERSMRAKARVRRPGQESPVTWQARMWNAAQGWRWVRSWSVAFTRSEDGTPRQILSISIDVTDEVEMEHRLRQTERLTSIGTLAAGIAHEINNPLASVVMAAQLLRKRSSEAKDAEMLDNLIEDAKRCGRIVRSVQKFARQEPSEHTEQNLNAVVHAADELSRKELGRSDIRLELELDESLPKVKGDATELEQVILNLIRNAAHASSKGKRIVVRTAAAGGYVKVSVCDEGCGMSPEVRRRVFDPFFTTRVNEGGTGLGLSISHGIIEDHGGKFSIDSRVGEGTTVTISLPIGTDAS